MAFIRDLMLGIRQFARRPGFFAAAIASLAIGIGLNTTLFSVVNAVLLRGGPIDRPEQLVEIYTGLHRDYPQLTTSYPDFLDIVAGADALAGVSANAYVRGVLAGAGRPALVTGEAVTANYFELLGIHPALGRGFLADENVTPGGHPVVVLSHGLWQRQFGGRADIVGQPVRISGVTYTVIGVGPQDFTGTLPGIPTEFWVPVVMVEALEFSGVQTTTDINPGATRLERRGTRWLFVKGRLAPGRTVEQVRGQLDAIFARLQTEYPQTNTDARPSVVPASSIRFHPMLDGYVRAASALVLGAVSLVLIIACANVANMLLALYADRRYELALRVALGASRGRIVRQLLTETLGLVVASGALGVAIAWWAGKALSGYGTGVFPMPISFDFSIDARVLMFAIGTSAATALLCALMPALSSSRPGLLAVMKGSDGAERRRRVRLSDVLVVAQLALSLVLLVSGTLLARGLLSARNMDTGFDPTPVASLSFNTQMIGYDVARATALRDRALQALRALPGVEAASTASRLPLAPDINAGEVFVRGVHTTEGGGAITDTVSVGADYFRTVGVPIVAGRAFTNDDVATGGRVAILNETMARQYWPDGSAVGRLIYPRGFEHDPYEIVGVARDHSVRAVGEAQRAYLHLPAGPSRAIGLVVRTTMPAADALPMLRQALWSLEPDIVFTEDVPASAIVATTLEPTRVGAFMLGAFGGVALLLAAVGLYGVIAYSVSRRRREVGIRLALGASPGRVLRLIMLKGARLAGVGIVVGLATAALTSSLIESLLYGIDGLDPLAYLVAAGVLLSVALAANLLPALSAARVDPARSIRAE